MTEPQFIRGGVSAGDCIGNAWSQIGRRYWLYVGLTFLTFIFVSYFYCISWFVVGPMMGGLAFVVLRDMRGEAVDFGMLFKGFEKFVPLMIVGLVQSIPRILGDILGIVANIAQLAVLPIMDRDGDFFQSTSNPNFAITGTIIAIFALVMLVFLVFAVLWRLAFFCAIPLVMEHDLAPADAIKLSMKAGFANPGGLIGLAILEALVMIGSFLLLCVGIFFIGIPIWLVADVLAYRMIFPYVQDVRNMAPPPPTAYGDFGTRPL